MGQSGRYELKYVIEEERARALGNYVSKFLRPSKHNGTGLVRGHPVVSLYLDSPDLIFFRQGFAGQRNRTKLRIRIYDNVWERPASLEIKRRVGDVIVKQRAMISREGVRQMLTRCGGIFTYMPDYSQLIHGKRRADILHHFVDLCNGYKVRGMIYVSYLREIFEAPDDDELRITLDRQIRGTPYDGTGRLTVPPMGSVPNLRYYSYKDVVLELKFKGKYPKWMEHLVRTFDLERRSVCKYCTCIDGMGLQWGRPVLAEQQLPWCYQTND
jgi:hypothetical protein